MGVAEGTAPALGLGHKEGLKLRVEALQLRAETEALGREGLNQVHGVGVGAGVGGEAGAHVAALNGVVAGEAEQGDVLGLILGQGQGAVVFQEDATFLVHTLPQVLDGLQELCGAAVVGRKGVQLAGIGFFGDNP